MEAIQTDIPVNPLPRSHCNTPEQSGVGEQKVLAERSANLNVEASAPPVVEEAPEESTQALSYKRSEKAALLIRTREGDVVRLRFKAREAVSVEAQSLEDGEARLAEIELKARESIRIAVFVKGDINADELAAIQSVIEQAGSLAGEFFGGDAADAFAQASSLNFDGQQLAKVALRLKVREQLTYTRTGPALPLPAAVDPGEAIASQATRIAVGGSSSGGESERPATGVVNSTPEPEAVEESSEAGAEEQAEAPSVVDASGNQNPFAVLGAVLDFLSQLLDVLGRGESGGDQSDGDSSAPGEEQGNTGRAQGIVDFSLKLRVFSSIVASFSSVSGSESGDDASDADGDSDSAAVGLLNDAVDSMAAEQEAPLDEVA